MSEITIFTIPKPFIGNINIIQRNSIQSWLKLVSANQIFLFGDEFGVAENAKEFGINHIPFIRRTNLGTPLINDAFNQTKSIVQTRFLCYLNSDIILLSDVAKILSNIKKNEFLLVGRRWNLDVEKPIDFYADWESNIRAEVEKRGKLFSEFGIDYFIFPSELCIDMPDFAVGRPGWDNWLIYQIRSQRKCVIDATEGIMAIHQNHDYSHIPKATKVNSYFGPEADENLRLIGSEKCLFSVNDATHSYKNGKLVIDYDGYRIFWRVEHQQVLLKNDISRFVIKCINYAYKILIRLITK